MNYQACPIATSLFSPAFSSHHLSPLTRPLATSAMHIHMLLPLPSPPLSFSRPRHQEFLEALLRLSVLHAGPPPPPKPVANPKASKGNKKGKGKGGGGGEGGPPKHHLVATSADTWLRDALVPTLIQLAGELDGGHIKLSWERLQQLIGEEQRRLDGVRVEMMWDDFVRTCSRPRRPQAISAHAISNRISPPLTSALDPPPPPPLDPGFPAPSPAPSTRPFPSSPPPPQCLPGVGRRSLPAPTSH